MRSTILDTGGFTYMVEVRPLDAVPGSFSLTVTSAWRGAKDPTDERTVFRACLDRAGLLALRDLVDQTVPS